MAQGGGLLRRAGTHGLAILGRGLSAQEEKGRGQCGPALAMRAGLRERGSGRLGQKPGREKVSLFFLFSKLLNPFSDEFESPFEIKHNQIDSAQNMHQHEFSSMYSNFDVDFILINLLFSLCLNTHTSKSKSI